MTSLALHQTAYSSPAQEPAIPVHWRARLNALRMIALECRTAASADLFKACAMLSNKEDTARDAHARALIKCLAPAIGHRPVFFRPGVEELSFDEAWLMRAIDAAKAADLDSMAFLVRSRVPKLFQRHVAFLIKGISEQFSQI
ncbi:hypothetical protein ACJ5NV_06705 [Loktanella agnita]|uniref:hypothetical protein n=1 Tax=Loktanella agnita TaxID=287097 RepID=UPI003987F5D4